MSRIVLATITFFSALFTMLIPLSLKKNELRIKKNCRVIIALVYLGLVLYITILHRTPGVEHEKNMVLFWSYKEFSKYYVRWQIYMNVFMFIPIGYMLRWTLNLKQTKCILLGMCISVLIEVSQYALRCGLCEIDDIIHNTLGALFGCLYYTMLNRIIN